MPHPEITVGTLAVAKCNFAPGFLAARFSGACEVGEPGVCFHVFTREGVPEHWFIFESGNYGPFRPKDIDADLDVSGRVSKDLAGYELMNAEQLVSDFRAGRFAAAFAEGRELASVPLWPQAQDTESASSEPKRDREPDTEIDR